MPRLGFLSDGASEDFHFAAEAGYECLEIALFGDTPLFDAPQSARAASLTSEIPVAAVSIFGQDPFASEEAYARIGRVVELAADVEAPVVVFGSGSTCPSTAAALEKLGPLIERARSLGVTPAFYNCHWENVVDRPAAWAGLPEGFAVKFDPSHPAQTGRDWAAELLSAGTRVVHAHAKDVLEVGGRFLPDPNPGFGDIRWERFFGILNHLGYDGAVCVEPHSPLYTGERRHEFLRLSLAYLSRFVP